MLKYVSRATKALALLAAGLYGLSRVLNPASADDGKTIVQNPNIVRVELPDGYLITHTEVDPEWTKLWCNIINGDCELKIHDTNDTDVPRGHYADRGDSGPGLDRFWPSREGRFVHPSDTDFQPLSEAYVKKIDRLESNVGKRIEAKLVFNFKKDYASSTDYHFYIDGMTQEPSVVFSIERDGTWEVITDYGVTIYKANNGGINVTEVRSAARESATIPINEQHRQAYLQYLRMIVNALPESESVRGEIAHKIELESILQLYPGLDTPLYRKTYLGQFIE